MVYPSDFGGHCYQFDVDLSSPFLCTYKYVYVPTKNIIVLCIVLWQISIEIMSYLYILLKLAFSYGHVI